MIQGLSLAILMVEKIGYVKFSEPRKIPLAVEGKEGEMMGYTAVDLEIAGHPMPEVEALGVMKGLHEEIIIGLNIIEKYDIILDTKVGKARLRKSPPEVVLI